MLTEEQEVIATEAESPENPAEVPIMEDGNEDMLVVDGIELGDDGSDLDEEPRDERPGRRRPMESPTEESPDERGYNDATTDGASKRQRMALVSERLQSLKQIMPISKAKQIVEMLEKERPELRGPTGNRRQRRTAEQLQGKQVSEIYSPPRMAAAAKRNGLQAGFSLDLTCDDIDGLPWDLSNPAKQQRARELLNTEKLIVLIASPMCGPFSSCMSVFSIPK